MLKILKKIFRLFRLLLFLSILIGLFTVLVFIIKVSFSLPDIKQLEYWKPAQTTKVYDYKGRLITEFFIQKRHYVPIEKIPDYVKFAFISVEDKTFYENIGVDFEGIIRAFIKNIKAGHIVEGGSTISQQLIKNLFLTSERSITRKLKEFILAIKLNRMYDKDKILELYLNQIYLGNGAYGVEAASLTYFGKHIWEIDICEASVLAGLPKAPSKYNPYYNLEGATIRRDVVLERMVMEGYITQEQAVNCKMQGIELASTPEEEKLKDYSTQAIRKWFTKRYGYENLYKGGYKIYTTIDKDLQQSAIEIVRDKIEYLQRRFGVKPLTKEEKEQLLFYYKKQKYGKRLTPNSVYIALIKKVKKNKVYFIIRDKEGSFLYKRASRYFKKGQPVYVRYLPNGKFEFVPYLETALIAINHKTGAIRAIAGGYDIKKSKFNRVFQSKRQVGSAFKPIVYAKALLEGYTQISKLEDKPMAFWDPDNYEEWIPENYEGEYYGEVSLRYALVHSLNAASVYLFDKLGEKPVIQLAYQLGIKTTLPPVKSLVLGSADISPLELANVYSTFANKGVNCEPYLIEKIVNDMGEVVYQHQPTCKAVIPEDTNAVLVDILKAVIKEGTGRKARVLELPLAGKTGTTNNYTDAWFAGFSPYITTVVWVGYDYKKKIGNSATGASVALPIWIDFMASAHAELETIEDFEIPENTAYYPINEETYSLATENCESKQMLFIIGTQPEVDCEGKFEMKLPKVESLINQQEIKEFDFLSEEEWLYEKSKQDKNMEKQEPIIDNNIKEDFIFDIKGEKE